LWILYVSEDKLYYFFFFHKLIKDLLKMIKRTYVWYLTKSTHANLKINNLHKGKEIYQSLLSYYF